MKQITVLLLILTTLNSFAQEEANTLDFKRVQIGINVSPDICYRMLKDTDHSSASGFISTYNNNNEIIKVGYTAGLNVCFNLSHLIGLETGIQYSNKGYQTKFQELFFAGYIQDAPMKVKYIYNFHYIDIPVKVNFTFGKNKVRFFTSVGLTTNVFIEETQTRISVYSNGKQKGTSPTNIDYNRINISPTVSVGFDYKINNRMNLRVEPTFRYGILTIIDAPIHGYLFSAGLNISYYFGT